MELVTYTSTITVGKNKRRKRWIGHTAPMRGTTDYTSVWKSERKRTLWRYTSRWEDNIKTNPRGRVLKGVDWIHLAQDSDVRGCDLVDVTMNLGVP
jgi:hypothetical protein